MEVDPKRDTEVIGIGHDIGEGKTMKQIADTVGYKIGKKFLKYEFIAVSYVSTALVSIKLENKQDRRFNVMTSVRVLVITIS